MEKQRLRQSHVRSALLLCLAGLFITFGYLAARQLGLADVHALASFITGFGLLSPLVLILLAIIASLTGVIPSYPLTMLSGAIWGSIEGSIYILIGIQSGATLSFLIARHGLLDWVTDLLGSHLSFYSRISDKYVTRFVFFSRLLPFFVSELISYGAGLTNIKFWHYFWATLLGSIPITFVLAWTGKIWFTENSPWLIALTVLSIVVLIGMPYVVDTYDPWGLKARLMRSEEDAKQVHGEELGDRHDRVS